MGIVKKKSDLVLFWLLLAFISCYPENSSFVQLVNRRRTNKITVMERLPEISTSIFSYRNSQKRRRC
jgi:hypothetical protein